jgi:hypoxanthine phosphoribosyltransferase
MPELIPVLKKDEIDHLVVQMARKISSDYHKSELVLIGILKGAYIFLADLARQLSIPVQVDFIAVSSYGAGTSSSGKIRLIKDIGIDILNKDVLIVEDIVDTGLTLAYIVDHVKSYSPNTVKVCALIDKRERRKTEVEIDYAGHSVSEGFLVGYGLDYSEYYRNLPDIYHLKL